LIIKELLQLQTCAGNSSVGTVSTWKFDPDDLRKSFAEMIIEDKQPLVLSNFWQKHVHDLFCHLEEHPLESI
jgi:hypothetical protein